MTEPGTAPRMGASRAAVLELLHSAGEALTSAEVAARLDVHPNSARFHLEGLVEADLVERQAQERSTPGRPRVAYRPVTDAPLDAVAAYRELAGMLAAAVVEEAPTPAAAAQAVGARQGRRLATEFRREPGEGATSVAKRAGTAGASEAVVRTLSRYGFDSRTRAGRGGDRIEVTPCPFLPLVRDHGEVVCALHHGLMDGVLRAMEAPVEVERLVPFETPNRCVAHLRRAAEVATRP